MPPYPNLFPPADGDLGQAMERLLRALAESRKLSRRHSQDLPKAVRRLWLSLVKDDGRRAKNYLARPEELSAYLAYFMPWNVYRYLRLLPSLGLDEALSSLEHPVILDIGAGPMSLAISLYLAYPGLRQRPLTLYALDVSAPAMEGGADILSSLALLDGISLPWKIHRVRGGLESPIKEGADLILCGFALNEFAGLGANPGARAKAFAATLGQRAKPRALALILESGDLGAASLLAGLREACIASEWEPLAPCPHAEPCPMPGRHIQAKTGRGDLVRSSEGQPIVLARAKRPWCHFKLDTSQAPKALAEVSRQAGLPKSDLSLSFLFLSRAGALEAGEGSRAHEDGIRLVSESFALPGGQRGAYACHRLGYALVRSPGRIARPGALIEGEIQAGRDPKTQALLFCPKAPMKPGAAPMKPGAAPKKPKP